MLQARLGAAVKRRRQELGLTQEELAWRAQMHRTYITDLERGVRNLTLRSMSDLAEALKTPLTSLLARSLEGLDERDRAGATAPRGRLGEILLVEDNPADVERTLRAFRDGGISNPVRVACDGADALDYLFCNGPYRGREVDARPDLVLLDLHLPKVSGVEVLRRIKADWRTKSIPVIVLTGSRRERDIRECRQLGAEHYLVKPVAFAALCGLIPKLSFRWALFSTPAD